MFSLPSIQSPFRTLLVVTHHSYADAAGDLTEEEMVGEPLQVDSSPISGLKVEALRMCAGSSDEGGQLLPKLVAQAVIDRIIVPQYSRDVSLYRWVVNHRHRPRSCLTRSTNSSCEIAVTCPDSNSLSRLSTSSSEISVPGGGSVSRSLAASKARSCSESASASSSMSASFMAVRYPRARLPASGGSPLIRRSAVTVLPESTDKMPHPASGQT